jgi:hypothetical protein
MPKTVSPPPSKSRARHRLPQPNVLVMTASIAGLLAVGMAAMVSVSGLFR